MSPLPLRRMASALMSKPSRILDELNSNARLVQWTQSHGTDRIFSDRLDLYRFLCKEVLQDKPIDYLEMGVYEGDSLRKWAKLNCCDESRFVGFDTFEGLPAIWGKIRRTVDAGHFDVGGVVPKTSDQRITFVKGLFQDTLSEYLQKHERKNRTVVHIDCDIYTSTLFCLTRLDDLLEPGDLLVFDEFYSSSHEFQAFYDYSRAYLREFSAVGAVGQHPYVQLALQRD